MLTQEKIQELKKRLEESRLQLEEEIDQLETPPDLSDNEGDREDEEADEAEEFSANASAALSLRQRHEDVIHALSRIERGQYGKCEKTGKDVELEVLEANPEARYCKDVIAQMNQ
ncbi:MAG: TraR/DksA C4-type zinc finger protein [Candidatus Harrisonbacteria bacterium]|nr:TraR/DksA C4-type zinc finger protein [Candidatus Harrisonbacteria bacterium]